MSNAALETAIEAAWEARDTITPHTKGEVRDAIESTLHALDQGQLRVAERQADGNWHVNQWAKKAVLLGFRLKDMEVQTGGPQGGSLVVGQGRQQVRPLGRGAVEGRGLPRRAELHRAPLGLYRQGRGADALVREPRRLRR